MGLSTPPPPPPPKVPQTLGGGGGQEKKDLKRGEVKSKKRERNTDRQKRQMLADKDAKRETKKDTVHLQRYK